MEIMDKRIHIGTYQGFDSIPTFCGVNLADKSRVTYHSKKSNCVQCIANFNRGFKK